MDGGVLLRFSTQICGDFAELFEGGFEVVNDFLGENVRIRKIVGLFEAFAAGYLSSQYKDAVAFVIILLVLLAMPNGLLGKPPLERV